jgi:hypothetical protein
MSLMNKLTQLTKSEKGKELIDKAQAIANDPKTREKIDTARGKVEAQVEAAKHKLAEKRGEKDDAAPTAETGSASATDPTTTPVPPAPTTSPPTEANYGGDEGPKAA